MFSICVKKTDDHLRNHGFLLTERGWILSPAYDINPVPAGTGLKLNISESDNALDLGLAMQVASYFRLADQKASKIIDHVKKSVEGWRLLAEKYKISPAKTDYCDCFLYYPLGIVNLKVLPAPDVDSTQILPPCNPTIFLQCARPIPVP